MKTTQVKVIIPMKTLEKVANDAVKCAETINLIYVKDSQPGIDRKKSKNSFRYFFNGKKIEDEEILMRIKKLVLPPAWENVWICKKENGHLQATGTDVKGRKQYRYHSNWNKLRNETKYFRLYEFGKSIPAIREQLEKDISLKELTLEKVLAAILMIMEKTTIRVGNSFYEKLYGSFGLTTLKDKHVKISGSQIKFTFKGKKGVEHMISLKSRRLAIIVKKCLDIPGKELFQFYDDNGNIHPIDSGMLNDYIKKISNQNFSSKDFRTWAGTVHALLKCKELGDCDDEKEMKQNTIKILDAVAKHLGNTRTVCKKYYVYPLIFELYESHKLGKYLNDPVMEEKYNAGFTQDEKVLMKIFEKNSKTPQMC